MSKAFAFALAGDGTETLELDVFSAIGAASWWSDTVSASQVRRLLKQNRKATLIRMRVHSDGGDTFDAQAIYADLQDHPARKEGDVMGLAASAATLVLMACDEIRMAEGAWFMIHEPWGGVQGLPQDLRQWANVLEQSGELYAKAYAKRSGMSEKDVLALMKAETWMTAAEAKAKGFVDKIVPMAERATATASAFAKAHQGALRSVAFSLASADYSNVPPALRAELELVRGNPPAPAPDPKPISLGQRPEPTENQDMTIPKSITAALNLVDGADEQSVATAIKQSQSRAGLFAKICALVGLTAGQAEDGVIGTVQAWKEGAAKLPELEKKIAADKSAADKSELDTLLNKGRDDRKLTKAKADDIRARVERFWAAKAENKEPGDEDWSLSQARSYVNALAVDPKLEGPKGATGSGGAPPPEPSANALTWEGKSYEQLSGTQSASLEESDPELFKQMRADWQKRGEPEFKAG